MTGFDAAIFKFPQVDEDNLRAEPANYAEADVIFFTRARGHALGGLRNAALIKAPGLGSPSPAMASLLPEPSCDLSFHSPRLRDPNALHNEDLWKRMTFISSMLHLAILVVALGFSLLSGWLGLTTPKITQVEFVDLAFGVNDAPSKPAAAPANPGPSEADLEALKTQQQLPQLPKTVAIEAEEKAPDTLPVPATRIPATPVATPKPQVDSTPDPGTKTLKQEELAKRLEKEKRTVGEKEREGTHRKPDKGAEDPFQLPADPFAKNETKGDAKSLPAGSPDGKISAIEQSYRAAVVAHIRRFWQLPDLYRFNPSLEARVEVVINLYGKVVSVKFDRRSGDPQFDDEVKAALTEANPFPDFQSEGKMTRRYVLRFTPAEIK